MNGWTYRWAAWINCDPKRPTCFAEGRLDLGGAVVAMMQSAEPLVRNQAARRSGTSSAMRCSLSASPLVTLAPAISQVAGALYTFLLVVFYVPVALIHERWRLDLQNQLAVGNDSFDSDQWQKKTGLVTSTVNSFSEIAALVSPLLAAIGVPLLAVRP